MAIDVSKFNQTFFDESLEGLEAMESGLLELEADTGDNEAINTIFRAAHSIKGGAGTLGFTAMADFTHHLETLLDRRRSGRGDVTQETIDVLLNSVDCLREMMSSAMTGEDVDLERVSQVEAELQQLVDSDPDVEDESSEQSSPEGSAGEQEEASAAGETSWRITFAPHPEMLRTGNDPVRILSELADLGTYEVEADTSAIPGLDELDVELSYAAWTIELRSIEGGESIDRTAIDPSMKVGSWLTLTLTLTLALRLRPQPRPRPRLMLKSRPRHRLRPRQRLRQGLRLRRRPRATRTTSSCRAKPTSVQRPRFTPNVVLRWKPPAMCRLAVVRSSESMQRCCSVSVRWPRVSWKARVDLSLSTGQSRLTGRCSSSALMSCSPATETNPPGSDDVERGRGMAPTTKEHDAREFCFEERHFQIVCSMAREQAGIELNETKEELVYGRLARRLRALGLREFDDYFALLQQSGSPELSGFVNAITTNVTSFFREPHHFDFMRDEALPRLMANRPDRRLRIWSAACSTGQEPYSIAATTADVLKASTGPEWDCKILATDIDSDALATGEAGVYNEHVLPSLSVLGEHEKWFRPNRDGGHRVAPALQKMIYFRPLNLMAPWPMQGKLDIIFCRNVVIYFSVETQRKLFSRFAEILAPDGYIFIGHSESMLHSADLFTMVAQATYQPTKTA